MYLFALVWTVDFGSSPNIAVMFFKTNTLVSLIPISSVHGSLAQLRSILNNMMLLLMNVQFVFIKGSSIISMSDVPPPSFRNE